MMKRGACVGIHWIGIAIILFVCFFDVIMGKPVNILAWRSYAGILLGLAVAGMGALLELKSK